MQFAVRGTRSLCLIAAFALLSTGCASLGSLGGGGRESDRPVDNTVIRPDADVAYDVMVGEMAAKDGDYEAARAAFLRAIVKDPTSAHLEYRVSRLSAQVDDLKSAILHGERGMALDPTDVAGRVFLGRLQLHRRSYPDAERALRGDDGVPLNSEAGLLLFQMYLERDQPARALATARGLLERDPDHLGAYLAIATVYERLREFELAEKALRDALAAHPDRFVLYTRLARLRRASGNRQSEIDLYREVLVERPDHYGTLVSLGEAQIALNDVNGAMETYQTLNSYYPDDLQAIRRLASLEFAAGRYEQAAERFERAAREHPDHLEFAYSLGQVKRSIGDDAEAKVAFERVPVSHPLYVEARMQIASMLEEEKDLVGALVELERLRELRPDRALDFHTASLRTRTGDLPGGVALLESMLETSPDDEEVLYQLGVLHGLAHQPREALEYMELCLEVNPENAHALNYIGYSLAEKGEDLDRAEALIERALEISPNDGYIADSLGWVYYMRALPLMAQGSTPDGIALLERAREQLRVADKLTGGDPVVSEHLGDVHLLMDDRMRALEFYEKAVDQEHREDEQPDLLDKLDRLRLDLGANGSR